MSLSHDTRSCGELPRVECCVKNVKGAPRSMIIEDIPNTSGLKDHVSHSDASNVLKKRKLIVRLKNPCLEFKDEKPDTYQ